MKTKFDVIHEITDEMCDRLEATALKDAECFYVDLDKDEEISFDEIRINEKQMEKSRIQQLDYLQKWRSPLEEPRVPRRKGEPADFDLGLDKRPLSKEEKELISWTTNTYKVIPKEQYDNYERITDEEIKLVSESIARGDYEGK